MLQQLFAAPLRTPLSMDDLKFVLGPHHQAAWTDWLSTKHCAHCQRNVLEHFITGHLWLTPNRCLRIDGHCADCGYRQEFNLSLLLPSTLRERTNYLMELEEMASANLR